MRYANPHRIRNRWRKNMKKRCSRAIFPIREVCSKETEDVVGFSKHVWLVLKFTPRLQSLRSRSGSRSIDEFPSLSFSNHRIRVKIYLESEKIKLEI